MNKWEEYSRTHSLMLPNDEPTKQGIIDSVYKQMQLIRIDFEYLTVKNFVNSYLDRIEFKERITYEFNTFYGTN